MDVCVVCCTIKTKEQARTIKTKEQARTIETKKQVRKNYKERPKEGIQKTKKKFLAKLCGICGEQSNMKIFSFFFSVLRFSSISIILPKLRVNLFIYHRLYSQNS